MQLYTHALSPYSAKVRIALYEKGLPFEEIALPIRRAGIVEKPDALVAANPRGQVPTLVDGDLVLYDSTVILAYLEERQPRPPLLPEGVAPRARARLLEDEADWMLATSVNDLLDETYRQPRGTSGDAGRIEAAAGRIREAYDRLEPLLEAAEHFGGAFGLADLALFVPISIAAFYGAPPNGGHPRLAAWLQRVAARPSVAREMAAMTDALRKLED